MKIFTEPWKVFFDWLPAWSALSRKTREFFATKIPNDLRVPTRVFDPACVAELRATGFIIGEAPRLPPSMRPFRRAIRAMYRHRVFDGSTNGMRAYIEDHLTHAEAISLLEYHSYHGNHWRNAESRASDEGWIRSFLDSRLGAEWEQNHTDHVCDTWLRKVTAVQYLKRWIRQCLDGDNPIPLSALASDQGKDPEAVSDALTAGVRYLLLFPSLRTDTLDPVVGIWPTVHRRMNRSKAKRPAAVSAPPPGAAVFGTPFLLHDMTTVLVSSFPDGLRLRRSGGGLFKRELDRLMALVSPVPADLVLSTDIEHRVQDACYWLEAMGFVRVKDEGGKEPALVATKDGKRWLTGNMGARLKAVLDALRKAYAERADRHIVWGAHLRFVSSEMNMGGWGYDKTLDPQRHLIEGFGGYPVGQWVSRDAFLDWQAESVNPLLKCSKSKASHYNSLMHDTAPQKEARWRTYVDEFIAGRLVPLACVEACVDASGSAWFSLTSAGAYLLGQIEVFEYSLPETAGQVLVQPNFDVVFTSAAPAIEGEFATLAERIGHGVGTIFRITRQAILAALDSGIDIDAGDIVQRLNDLTHKPLPANVTSQIEDWARSYRRVTVRRMVTIRCPDAETALHVQAIFPRLIRPVTETLLEVTNPKSLADIKKKLKRNGIGVE